VTRAGAPVIFGVLIEAAIGIALFAAIRPRPPAAPIDGAAPAVALGLAVGTCLLIVLAGRLPPRPRFTRSRLPAVGARACILGIASVAEELIWRVVALGALVPTLGSWLALALTAAGFAVSHAGSGRRAVAVHFVTGSAFGGVYLATASFAAAATAHASYNLGTLLAAESDARDRGPGQEQAA
jgi:membrane protease YdiL (CAAX protease family)